MKWRDVYKRQQLRQLIAAHIDDDSFCRYVIQQDINGIALDLREAHKDDFFSVPEDNPLKGLLQTADEAADESVDMEQASMAFICKRLRLNYKKSVSYTHLDGRGSTRQIFHVIFKLSLVAAMVVIIKSCLLYTSCSTRSSKLISAWVYRRCRVLSSQPVSYTHLDVYKRQPLICLNTWDK